MLVKETEPENVQGVVLVYPYGVERDMVLETKGTTIRTDGI